MNKYLVIYENKPKTVFGKYGSFISYTDAMSYKEAMRVVKKAMKSEFPRIIYKLVEVKKVKD